MASISQFDPKIVQNMYQFWTSKTGSPQAAAGIVANLLQESGGDPTALNDSEGAHGIAQWREGRFTALQELAEERGTAWTDLDTQRAHIWNEFQGSEAGSYQKILAAQDPAEAAAMMDQHYERSAGTERGVRENYAREIYDQYGHLPAQAADDMLTGTVFDDPNLEARGSAAMNLQGSTPQANGEFDMEGPDLYTQIMEAEEAREEGDGGTTIDITTGLRSLAKGLGQMAKGQPVDIADIGERADKLVAEKRERAAAARSKAATASYLMKMPGGEAYARMVAQGADPQAALKMYENAYIRQAMQERGISADEAAAELRMTHERTMQGEQHDFQRIENQATRNHDTAITQMREEGLNTRSTLDRIATNTRHAADLGYSYSTLMQDANQFERTISRSLANDKVAQEQFDKTFKLDEKKFAEALANTDWQQEFQEKGASQAISEFQVRTGIDLSRLNLDERQLQQLIVEQDRNFDLNQQQTASDLEMNEARINRIAHENGYTEAQKAALEQSTVRDQIIHDMNVETFNREAKTEEDRGRVQKQIIIETLKSRGDPESEQLAEMLADAPEEGFTDPGIMSQLGSILKKANTADNKTTDIKNFEYLLRNPVFAKYLEDKVRRNPEVANILPEALAQLAQQRITGSREAATVSESALGKVQQMTALLAQGNMSTGAFQQAIKPVVQFLADTVGLSDEAKKNLESQETFGGLANSMLPLLRQNYPGAMTNWEGQKFIDSFANVGLTEEANAQFLAFYEKMYERQIARAGAMEKHFEEHGDLVDFDDAWKERMEQGYADTAPMMLAPERMPIDALQSNLDAGNLRVGVPVYFVKTRIDSHGREVPVRDRETGDIVYEAIPLSEAALAELYDVAEGKVD